MIVSTVPQSDGEVFELLSADNTERTQLYRRKGGGGGHGSGHGSGRGSSSSGSHGSSPASSHGASVWKSKSSAEAYSNGGGKPFMLGSTSPFSGRQAGGGTRETVYGTSRFGSGYPYGGYGTYVDSRPLPYQFYPVPVSNNYYGGDEYLNVNDTERPGGNLVTAIVQPSYNTSSVTYRIVGDNASVTTVFDALVANCSVANSSSAISAFRPSPSSWPVPEQIVQYYRASSLALSLDGYNNTASLLSNMPASNTSAPVQLADTPLPGTLNMTFLECVNATTGSSAPLVDVKSHRLSEAAITGIVPRFPEVKEGKGLADARSQITGNGTRSLDERMLGSNAKTGKERQPYASSRSHAAAEQPRDGELTTAKDAGFMQKWLSKIRFASGRFGYHSVDSPSASNLDLPLYSAPYKSSDIDGKDTGKSVIAP
ncbi:hypothetical protein DFH11DRAFT_1823992 [Phellopilus nigrolimitatus]|nr:hypothetical protein DFH11DRAFT_1823992 [Phellopilus nigrolimitatus]